MRREEPFFIHKQKHVLYTHMCVYVCAGYAHVTFHSFIHNRNDTVAIQCSSHASTQFMRGVARRFDFRFTDMCVRVCVCVCVNASSPLSLLVCFHFDVSLQGIFAGHLYYFCVELYPRAHGVTIVSTPMFLYVASITMHHGHLTAASTAAALPLHRWMMGDSLWYSSDPSAPAYEYIYIYIYVCV